MRSGPGKTAKNQKKKEKKSTVVSSKKKSTVMSPIRRRMKKRNPSGGQNGQLVHWWLLIHSAQMSPVGQVAIMSGGDGSFQGKFKSYPDRFTSLQLRLLYAAMALVRESGRSDLNFVFFTVLF